MQSNHWEESQITWNAAEELKVREFQECAIQVRVSEIM